MRNLQVDVASAWRRRDPELTRYMLRLHRVMVEDVIDPSVLDDLEPRELLRLRYKSWGQLGENRFRLFQEVRKLAAECDNEAEFDERVAKEIDEYKVQWTAFQSGKSRLYTPLHRDAMQEPAAGCARPQCVRGTAAAGHRCQRTYVARRRTGHHRYLRQVRGQPRPHGARERARRGVSGVRARRA